eukprot:GHVO01050067.1.p1 GENE.GHVO01050067.1~~GHVO01050067.1.p1  ORF type:complete len:144 (+),score=21.31 GHVO01050067.1:159-590(+)
MHKQTTMKETKQEDQETGAIDTTRVYPLASEELTHQILSGVQQAVSHKLLRKGANEATKALNRGRAEIVILAADTQPVEILMHLPIVSEDKNIPYVYIKSKSALGRACGVSRPVIACAIMAKEGSPIQSQVNALKNAVEQILI